MPTTTSTQTISEERPRRSADDAGGGLLLVAGEGLLTLFPLLGDPCVIGRDPECDVVIADSTLSRRHARLRVGPPLTIEDLGSKNGTHVARQRLERGVTAPLSVGESFIIGRFGCVVLRT